MGTEVTLENTRRSRHLIFKYYITTKEHLIKIQRLSPEEAAVLKENLTQIVGF